MEIPYVSVIVPMYNAEKYISELLESLLAQTLKNFELIIVDDCSTDKSREIVESYIEKFEGRLKLMKLKTNSGSPSIPRNFGLEMSRGKYIFFMDHDDALIKNGLETMFIAAEKFKADIISTKYSFYSKGEGAMFLEKITGGIKNNDNECESYRTEDIELKIKLWLKRKFRVVPWCKLILRDFLIESRIKFLPVFQEDSIWTFELLCLSKKFVLIPTPCYINRSHSDSLSKTNLTDSASIIKNIRRKMDRTIKSIKKIDVFMESIPFFQKHPDYHYAVINNFLMIDLNWLQADCLKLPPHTIKKICQHEFKNELGEHDALISYLFTNSIMLMRSLNFANQKIKELSAPLKATKEV